MAIRNNMMYNLVNDSIYNIETQCKVFSQDIISRESNRLKNRIVKLGYPECKAKEAIIEFHNYFNNVSSN